MKIFRGSEAAKGKLKKPVVTMGVFDGVHRGHRHIFRQCLREAQKIGGCAFVYTFDPHPVSVLSPVACPPLLTTLPQKLDLLTACGFDATVVERFNKRFSQLKPEVFFQRIILGRLQAKSIYVGYNFTFGIHRSGTTELLKSLGERHGVAVHIVNAFMLNENLVSSTEIRNKILEGNIPLANKLLGRDYSIEGKIVHGEGLGGQIGIHTANLAPINEILPANGVYATYSFLKKRRHRSVTNIGTRPTFDGKRRSVESHLLRFRRKILGQPMRLEFLARLRDEQRFDSPEKLVKQIHKDIEKAQKFFGKGL